MSIQFFVTLRLEITDQNEIVQLHIFSVEKTSKERELVKEAIHILHMEYNTEMLRHQYTKILQLYC
jgi:hypothetical protein